MAKLDFDNNKISAIDKEIAKLQKQKDKEMARCPHTSKSGKSKLRILPDEVSVICEKCGARFSLNIYSMEQLSAARNTFNDVINQIKISTVNDSDAAAATIDVLGGLNFDIKSVINLYEKRVILQSSTKKKKKNKFRDEEYGKYGVSSLLNEPQRRGGKGRY